MGSVMPVVKKAIGQRGSWFAAVDDEDLPCVHAHWFKVINTTMTRMLAPMITASKNRLKRSEKRNA